MTTLPMRADVSLGLRANWGQFALLVVVNAFDGAMVGLERAVLPVLATTEFHIASTTAVLSFIASFGLTKAITNLAAGWLADRHARRPALLAGWLIALPVPLLKRLPKLRSGWPRRASRRLPARLLELWGDAASPFVPHL